MADSKSPSGIDRIVGQRLRWRRRELRLTQEQLGDMLGLTFQQVQKYEKGVNRVSAGRLFELATRLSVPIDYFYRGIGDLLSREPSAVFEPPPAPDFPVIDRDSIELITAFQKIQDEVLKRSLLNTVRAAAASVNAAAASSETK